MTAKDFRRIALGLEGVVEGAHMGHPDFRAGGKIFATIHPDHLSGMVKLTPEQQEQFVHDHPEIYTPENGAWGRAGCTRVRLAAADEETVGEGMTLAWQQAQKGTKAPGPRAQAPGPKAQGKRQKAKGKAT